MAKTPGTSDPERRIAMLIDGDNAQHKLIEQMLAEASRYGTVTIRRAYGDFTKPDMANWGPAMQAHGIQPIVQMRYTTGKNATDSSLIIDAMDILYSGSVQGFCIVSSDSDYTRLCTRIREAGFFVMGIGRQQTPPAFVNACDIFVYVENLDQANEAKTTTKNKTPGYTETATTEKTQPAAKKTKPPKKLVTLLRSAFDIAAEDDDGWVHLGALGNALQRIEPSFDSRTYGFKRLSELIQSMPTQLEIKGVKKTGTSTIHVRMKEN